MSIVSYFNFSFSSISTSLKSSSTELKLKRPLIGVGRFLSFQIPSQGYINLSSEEGHQKQFLRNTLWVKLKSCQPNKRKINLILVS